MAADEIGPRYPYNWPQYLRSDYCAEPPPVPLDWEHTLRSKEDWTGCKPIVEIYEESEDSSTIQNTHWVYLMDTH